jgi:hypothetical protein
MIPHCAMQFLAPLLLRICLSTGLNKVAFSLCEPALHPFVIPV